MHPIRTPRDHPSKGKKPSCGLFPSESSSACQSGLHGRYKLEFCSQQDLDTHIKHFPCNVRTPCGVSPLREQTTLIFVFQWLLLSFCSLFWFGICSFPLHWGFQKLLDFLTFLKFDILGFSIGHSDILIGISCSELTPGDRSGIFS